MYAIKIINIYTGNSYLYPTVYQTIEDAEEAVGFNCREKIKIKQIPQARGNNKLEIVILK